LEKGAIEPVSRATISKEGEKRGGNAIIIDQKKGRLKESKTTEA